MLFRRIELYLLILLAVTTLNSGTAVEFTLVFTHYNSGESGTHLQHLSNVTFSATGAGAPTELLTLPVPTSTNRSAARFDLGRNYIHHNRWLVTGNGDIFDLVQKKLILQTHDRFVRAGIDSLIFYTNDIIRGKYYSYFNERTATYTQITKPGWKALVGRDVEPDCSSLPFHLYEYPNGAPKIELVANAGCGENLLLRPAEKPSCPLFWINQQQFVFPQYADQGQTLTILLVNAVTHQITEIGKLTDVQPSKLPFRFLPGENNQLLFHCAKGWYAINTTDQHIYAENKLDVGNGFSIGLDAYSLQGNPVLYRGQSIGTYFCDPEAVYTTQGRIAFCADQLVGGERFRKGIAVWTEASKTWKWVSDSDAAAVCGWIN